MNSLAKVKASLIPSGDYWFENRISKIPSCYWFIHSAGLPSILQGLPASSTNCLEILPDFIYSFSETSKATSILSRVILVSMFLMAAAMRLSASVISSP